MGRHRRVLRLPFPSDVARGAAAIRLELMRLTEEDETVTKAFEDCWWGV